MRGQFAEGEYDDIPDNIRRSMESLLLDDAEDDDRIDCSRRMVEEVSENATRNEYQHHEVLLEVEKSTSAEDSNVIPPESMVNSFKPRKQSLGALNSFALLSSEEDVGSEGEKAVGLDVMKSTESSSAKKKKKSSRKNKAKASKVIKDEDIGSLQAEFLTAIESCFSLEPYNIKADANFNKLPYSVKLDLFDLAKADFDESGHTLNHLSNLSQRIKGIYQLLQIDALSYVESNMSGDDMADLSLNVNARITLLICAAI